MSATLSGGLLTYTGTDRDDSATVTVSLGEAGKRLVTLETFDALGALASVEEFDGVECVTMMGHGGDDTLTVIGDGLTVTLNGGRGNDNLFAYGAGRTMATLVGGTGDDYLDAIAGVSIVDGGDGADLLYALGYTPGGEYGGETTILAGDGDDYVSATAGRLAINCGDGNDHASFTSKSGKVFGGKGADHLVSVQPFADWSSGEVGKGTSINGQKDADIIEALTTDKVSGNVKGNTITIGSDPK